MFGVAVDFMHHTVFALSAVQAAITNRLTALRQRDWLVRYRGILPPIATAAAAGSSAGLQADSSMDGNSKFVHMFAVGVAPEQLTYLALEFLAVLGFSPDRTEPAMSAVALVHTLLSQAVPLRLLLSQATPLRMFPQHALERSVREGYARGCLEYIWSGLGKQLLTAAGVTDAELDGDGSEGAADRPHALAFTATIMREGTTMEMPADAQERLRMVWGLFGNCLFHAIRLYEGTAGVGKGGLINCYCYCYCYMVQDLPEHPVGSQRGSWGTSVIVRI
jgi:hypothetical protein